MIDFFSRYSDRIATGEADACWLWTGARIAAGYGHGHRDRAHFYAHRAAYESSHGPGSAHGLIVRHRCDNPPCCNPAHLEVGTQADNCQDMIKRGRGRPAKGERAPTSKLTDRDVMVMRGLAAGGLPIARIVDLYPLKHDTVAMAVRGDTWGHLPGAVADPTRAPVRGRRPGEGAKLLSAEKVAVIKQRIRAGEGNRAIAADYGVSHVTVSAIRNGRLWSHVD